MASSGARITVVETVYHRPDPHSQASAVQSNFIRKLLTDEQAWGPRSFKVKETWEPLDLGWLKDAGVGMLVLRNEEGTHPQRNPTPEEKAAIEASVVEVGVSLQSYLSWSSEVVVPILLLPPGESLRITPTDPRLLMLRTQTGVARCVLTLFPR